MGKPKVWVGRRLPQAALDLLAADVELTVFPGELPASRADILAAVPGCDGLVPLLSDRIDSDVIDAAGPSLKVIANYAVGYDNIDLAAAGARGIWVTNTPDVLTETTADLAWALLMAAARRIGEGERYARSGQWKTWGPLLLLGHDVHGKTLGIIGCGRIGRAVARRATGFGMRLLYHSRSRDEALEAELPIEFVGFEQLLRQSDFVSLHCPLNDDTRHLIDAAALTMMKQSAILINTARGPVVDQAALVDALRIGEIAGAGLDVTDPEPPEPDDPLLQLDNAVVIPHLGSGSHETRTAMANLVVDNLLAVFRGERPPTPVNDPEAT